MPTYEVMQLVKGELTEELERRGFFSSVEVALVCGEDLLQQMQTWRKRNVSNVDENGNPCDVSIT